MSVLDMRTRAGSKLGYSLAYHLEQQDPSPAGEAYISMADLAVLLGIEPVELGAEMQRQGEDNFTVPDTWVAAGRRRVAEAEAAGVVGLTDVVAHLRAAS